MAVQVSQATLDALTAQHQTAVVDRDGYQNEADKRAQLADDLAVILADLEVAP